MAATRASPKPVKINRSYTVAELAARLGVHKNTVRQLQREGMDAIDKVRPLLFEGATVRDFLLKRSASRKRPCPPGTMYCFRCRAARAPALHMVDYVPKTPKSGNLKAICGTCDAMMHRQALAADLEAIMPGCDIQIGEGQSRLSGSPTPSLNCDLERPPET